MSETEVFMFVWTLIVFLVGMASGLLLAFKIGKNAMDGDV